MTKHINIDEILSSLVNEVEWCVNPAAGAISVNREKEKIAQDQAKADLQALIETSNREAQVSILRGFRRRDFVSGDFYEHAIIDRLQALNKGDDNG